MKKTIALAIICGLFACSLNESKEEHSIKNILKTYGKDPKLSKKAYLIFFDSGCGACVKMTSEFVESNIDSLDAEIIVSSNSMKEINIRFQRMTQSKENFVADHKFLAREIIGIYPKVFFVEEGRIVGQVEVNYGNAKDVFDMIVSKAGKNH